MAGEALGEAPTRPESSPPQPSGGGDDVERKTARLLGEAVRRLASVVSSVDCKVSELMARLPDAVPQLGGGAGDEQLGSSEEQQRQAASCSAGGDAAIGKIVLEAMSPALAQQRNDLTLTVQWLQSQMDAVARQLQQMGSAQKQLVQQQQQLLDELRDKAKAASGSESFRAHASCYDVAVLADDRLLLATNKGVREYSPRGRELSRFLREDLAVAVDAFGYDGRVAVLLRSRGAAKAASASDRARQPADGGSTVVVIMSRDAPWSAAAAADASAADADWLEEGRFSMTPEVTCLATIPESGQLLVACGLGKPDVYCLTRSGSVNFQMKARYGVRAIAATSCAIVIASSDQRAVDGLYVVEAYCDKGKQLLWERPCKDQAYDLCCDPWGGVYASFKDRGLVMLVCDGRQDPGKGQGEQAAQCSGSAPALRELVSGLSKPACLSMDSRARRLVVLSYDGRVVNALKCKTLQIELNPII